MPEIYNKTDAARELKISVETINRNLKNGKLPYRKIGASVRFTENDLATFLERCAVSALNKPAGREKHEMGKTASGGEI